MNEKKKKTKGDKNKNMDKQKYKNILFTTLG
jgi:hypothetical protein